MPRLLRFQLYDDPSRKTTTQLHPDIFDKENETYGYGETVQIGDAEADPDTWPHYVVANISRVLREIDPDQPGEERVVYEVYLARLEEWEQFGEPEIFERIRRGRKIE